LVQTIPWWLMWRSVSIWHLIIVGISSLQSCTIRSLSIVRWCLTCKYGLQSSGNWDLWSGYPWRIVFFRAWYSLSSCAHSCSSCSLTLESSLLVIARISAMDGSVVLSSSYSPSRSVLWGSATGCLERASGAWFVAPLHHTAVKLYAIILMHKHCNQQFSISSYQWLLSMGMIGQWSVTIVKLLMPVRNILHFSTAHATASSSNSITHTLTQHCLESRIQLALESIYL